MAHYFFHATSNELLVTDFRGQGINHADELAPAMLEVVRTIRHFLTAELSAQAWTLEVRTDAGERVTEIPFEDVEARRQAAAAHEPLPLAA